jgi:hypothetical protein
MATVQEVVYTDDLTGKQLNAGAFWTIRLVIDDVAYELHLSGKSKTAWEKALQPFIENTVGEKVKLPAHGSRISLFSQRRPATVDREQNRAIRNWLADNWQNAGLDPPSWKGRIPVAAVEAFQRYGGKKVPPAA